MRGTSRYLIRLILVAFPISFLLILSAPSPTHADVGCNLNSLAEPSGTATLSLTVPHIDNATWTSTINLNVPLSWPPARDLFQNASSDSFQHAFNCLFPDNIVFLSLPSSPTISVSRDGDYAKLKMFSQGAISDWGVYISWPWDVNVSQQALSVGFVPGPDKPNINWTSITATTHGFRITNPKPVPASNSGTQFTWQQMTSGQKVNLVAFSLIPEKFLRIAMTAQNDGLWQSIRLQAEELLFPILFILILNRRRRQRNECSRRCLDRHPGDCASLLPPWRPWNSYSISSTGGRSSCAGRTRATISDSYALYTQPHSPPPAVLYAKPAGGWQDFPCP